MSFCSLFVEQMKETQETNRDYYHLLALVFRGRDREVEGSEETRAEKDHVFLVRVAPR